MAGAEKVVLGDSPFSRAVTRANGLNALPVWRPYFPPLPVARFTRPPLVSFQ